MLENLRVILNMILRIPIQINIEQYVTQKPYERQLFLLGKNEDLSQLIIMQQIL